MEEHIITVASPVRCTLGEAPIWDGEALYWVDIVGQTIFKLVNGRTSSWKVDELVGFVLPVGPDMLLAGFASGLHRVSLHAGGSIFSERIDTLEGGVRFNDAGRAPGGGFVACTMDMEQKHPLGKYFYYDADLHRHVIDEGYIIPNGPCFSPDGKYIYTVGTPGRSIYRSLFNGPSRITGTECIINWNYNTHPDGIILGPDGNLWVGEYGGNTLRAFSLTGELLHEIPLPAMNITKAAFGPRGEIYVTSAMQGATKEYPHTGCLLCIEPAG